MRPAINKLLGLGAVLLVVTDVALAARATALIKREDYSLAHLIENSSLGAGYDQGSSCQTGEKFYFL